MRFPGRHNQLRHQFPFHGLAFDPRLITRSGRPTTVSSWVGEMDVDLAAAQSSVYDIYEVEFQWLAEQVRIAVLVGPGKECLLGTELLNPYRLEIDYGQRTVYLIRNPSW